MDIHQPGPKRKVFKAYKDPDFMNSEAARSLRILAEYLGPRERFAKENIHDTIVIFGSARLLPRETAVQMLQTARARNEDTSAAERAVRMSEYYEAAREIARKLTEWSNQLGDQGRRFAICSGGGPGIMEAANRGAREANGKTVGLSISLPHEQQGNQYITPQLDFEFHYFFTRKFWFAYLAKAFIVMPGGFGTLDELMEILTLMQTQKMTKPTPIVLFGKEFWNKVINFEALIEFGTISRADLDLFHITDDIDDTVEHITSRLLLPPLSLPGGSM